MNRARALVILLSLFILTGAGLRLAWAQPPSSNDHSVLSLSLGGVVDPFEASYIKRGIDTANSEGYAAVAITIDTPGGLDSSMREIVKAILRSEVPVICFTGPSGARAASAGTFVMLACPVNAMAPGTNIGAAHPVGVADAIELEKVTNDAAAFIRSLADRWDRNADWAEQSVREAVSVSAEEAVRIHVVDGLAGSVRDVVAPSAACGGSTASPSALDSVEQRNLGRVLRICDVTFRSLGLSPAEGLFHAFADPNIAFLFLTIGFVSLIVFALHPGLHLSLALGVVLTVIGFLILQTLPVQLVGVVLLFVTGVLFVVDVKANAHGALTAGGLITLVLGGLLLFNPAVPSARVSLPLIIVVAVAVTLFMFFVVRALLGVKGHPVQTGMEALEGSVGIASTALDPRGTVRARAETWTAESLEGPIPAGAPVLIERVKGVKLLVRPQTAPVETAVGPSSEGRTV